MILQYKERNNVPNDWLKFNRKMKPKITKEEIIARRESFSVEDLRYLDYDHIEYFIRDDNGKILGSDGFKTDEFTLTRLEKEARENPESCNTNKLFRFTENIREIWKEKY